MAKRVLTVFISSTVADLTTHREQARDACRRAGMLPEAMDVWPASDADGVHQSLAHVDGADVFIGILGSRYGCVPHGSAKSITEMEYDHATARGIPRLMFLMDAQNHRLTLDMVETGAGAASLARFKERVRLAHTVEFFVSAEDLRGKIVDALRQVENTDQPMPLQARVNPIPAPPHPYIAHTYTLLETVGLIGREQELAELDAWSDDAHAAPVYCVRAIGGMGKSALTWEWFQKHAPARQPAFVGSIWWSFYEQNATYSNFLKHAVAYVTRRPLRDFESVSEADCEELFFQELEEKPLLIAFDGLERELLAYCSDDARDETQSEATAADRDAHLCRAQNPAFDRVLSRMVRLTRSRVLISTRLLPTALRDRAGHPRAGCREKKLEGLSDGDALQLWQHYTGSEIGGVIDLLNSFGKHPLLIQTLAAEVGRFRAAPGDYATWRRANTGFDPFRLELKQRKSHVLEFALRGLAPDVRRTLETIAAFRMPAAYDLLEGLLVREMDVFQTVSQLDRALTELEERALVGWDRMTNRYDLHPLVRGVVWSATRGREELLENMYSYFDDLPEIEEDVKSIDELALPIQMYTCLVGLQRYDDAAWLFRYRLASPLVERLSEFREAARLLEELRSAAECSESEVFEVPMLYLYFTQIGCDDYERGESAYRLHARTCGEPGCELHLASVLCDRGRLREAETISRALVDSDDTYAKSKALLYTANVLHARGHQDAQMFYDRARAAVSKNVEREYADALVLRINVKRLDDLIDVGDFEAAEVLARDLFAHVSESGKADEITTMRVAFARVKREKKQYTEARALALQALRGYRTIGALTGEASALVELGLIAKDEGDLDGAADLYVSAHAIARRIQLPGVLSTCERAIAELELARSNEAAAAEAAAASYVNAWCDGPPYALAVALRKSAEILKKLGRTLPVIPPERSSVPRVLG